MERITGSNSTKKCRELAVRMVLEGWCSIPEASRNLGLSVQTVGSWIRLYHNTGKRTAFHC